MPAEQICFTPAGIAVIGMLLGAMGLALAKQYHDGERRTVAENAYLKKLLLQSLSLNEEQAKDLRRTP